MTPPAAERTPRILVAVVMLGTLAEQLHAALTTRELPRDLNMAYQLLPMVYGQLHQGQLGRALGSLREPGGWYELAIAAWLSVVGRSGPGFAAAGIVAMGVLLAAVAGIARRWHGPWGALAAVGLVAQIPVLVLQARAGWVHSPEAALVTAAAWALVRDPALERRGTVGVLAVAGMGIVALRPSGLVWCALLAVAIVSVNGLRGKARGAVIGAAWAFGALVSAPILGGYLGGKLAIRGRYAAAVPGVLAQWGVHLMPVAAVLVAVGVLLGLRVRGDRLRGVLLGSWIGVPLLGYAVFQAGLDNFPLFYVGLALLAAAGLARPLRAGLALVGWLGMMGWRVAHAPEGPSSADRVEALLDATCPARTQRTCTILVDQGLFFPQSEEPGLLELFLLREDRVRVAPLFQRQPPAPPVALATWSCGARDAAWRDRFPDYDAQLTRVVTRYRLSEAWSGQEEGCTFRWLTPGGTVERKEALP